MLSFKYFKTIRLLIVLSFILIGTGCDEKSSGSSSSGGSSSSSHSSSTNCSSCSSLRARISDLEQENARISQNLSAAVTEKNNAISERDNAISERDKAIAAQQIAEKEARDRYIVLSVIAYIALGIGILLIGGFLLMIRSAKKNTPKAVIDNLHCPRCGWEHAAGETICKNCKTHF